MKWNKIKWIIKKSRHRATNEKRCELIKNINSKEQGGVFQTHAHTHVTPPYVYVDGTHTSVSHRGNAYGYLDNIVIDILDVFFYVALFILKDFFIFTFRKSKKYF